MLSSPNIQNILGRITGNNPSFINGLIQVNGGNSNLFLINPSGIIFGQNAIINVPANFSATTATGIGFDNGIFNAIGDNNFSNLTGNPNSFIFNTNNPGSILNTSHNTGVAGDFNLIGGNVINSQTITTSGSKLNIVALNRLGRIKITPEGSLLSIELNIPTDERGNSLGFTPQDLPALLTGSDQSLTGIEVTVNSDGINVISVEGVGETRGSLDGNIITGDLISNGGNINLLSQGGGIVTGDINSSSALPSGFININSSEYVITKNINASSIDEAGNVTIIARDENNFRRYENGEIKDQNDADDLIVGIQLDSIDDRSSEGVGGQVNLFSQSIIRAFGSLPNNDLLNLSANPNFTISTRGALSGDSLTITYKINDILKDDDFLNQEAFRIPFQVGESTTTLTIFEDTDDNTTITLGNGTENGIETGDTILTEGNFLFDETIDNIEILSDPATPDVEERKTDPYNCTSKPWRSGRGNDESVGKY
ncbi:MAG: filamentous hemagglutinin N-terminal domain-containing protein [Cyanobacterium sp. T60_A2020_053]|nr:filamentous hemagglutinin N-terminal domain-containing protein [Cyanobacterium sp. T60_A2020_053]